MAQRCSSRSRSAASGPNTGSRVPAAIVRPTGQEALVRRHTRNVLSIKPRCPSQAQESQDEEALRAAWAELADARRQWHSLQVEMESLQALEKGLESSLRSTQKQYKVQLEDLSMVIRRLESELGQVRSDIESQRQLHLQLLNTKVRLEQEITTYRQLLECEEGRIRVHNELMGKMKCEPQPQVRRERCADPSPKQLVEVRSGDTAHKRNPALSRTKKSLVFFTEPERRAEKNSAPAKTQQVLRGTVMRESAEAHGTVESKKIDVVIKQWEGSFFKGNPKLRKKSVSLRFDLHMAAADDGCAQTQQDDLPDVEVRLVMKRSRSIPSMTQ
ncbi:keratin-like protein KRT222 [Scleropages formosus]|uniref:Keratin 222 n=1 Tax=Scleropages formosus TaxID=113540 RepID=A0A8C9QYC1_SCLFO|nr:keratin-like protein KRT222 [Scleropages formosus]